MPIRAPRLAVIDIGSNSVRLVVYAGDRRIPSIIFNEKILAGLGSELATTGNIGEQSFERAMKALRRFKILCDKFRVDSIDVIATAAVRDAHNGADFVIAAKAIGLNIVTIDGHQEAQYSALGVMSAFPGQDGIMADLGGGSLELAQISDGQILQRVSLPMGVLRVQKWFEEGYDQIYATFQKYLTDAGWIPVADHMPLFLVGGSWRSLARVDMDRKNYPLRVVDHYEIDPLRIDDMMQSIAIDMSKDLYIELGISSSRIKTLPVAAALLKAVVQSFDSQQVRVSAFGLREGLLFSKLNDEERSIDPLMISTKQFARTQRRFHDKKAPIFDWISTLFEDESKSERRIRRAFCNLCDVAWMANPDFRAEWALEIGLHGRWSAISAGERDMLGQALFSCFGGGAKLYPNGGKLANAAEMQLAITWGLAARLAQRLSGGRDEPLSKTKVSIDKNMLTLYCQTKYMDLCGESVSKRVSQLASFLNKDSQIIDI